MMDVRLDKKGVCINGEYKVLLCSSLFYFRLPKNVWKKRITDLVKTGYNTVDVYFPWNYHETEKGVFEFDGEKDAAEFLQLCAQNELYVIARPGPYICSEWDGGSLPAWVCGGKMVARSADPEFLTLAGAWYDKIIPIIAAKQLGVGGSVILVQLENELDFFDCKSVEQYIGYLNSNAIKNGITVPMFCCSGQSGAEFSGGICENTVATYNFYPSITDPFFDYNCAYYNQCLAKKDLPLLVSETGREHSLLKRELMAGAKLLGAYNQVAGSNFGFTQSINNWGGRAKPEAILTTKYDFGSMISCLGDYSREADEARLFSSMLRAYGTGLAAAQSGEAHYKINADFAVPVVNNLLELLGGGKLIMIANLSASTGNATVSANHTFNVTVPPYKTYILPIDVPTTQGKIVYSNYEVYSLSPLVFVGEGVADICIEKGGKRLNINCSGEYGGVSIEVLSTAQAIAYDKKLSGASFAYVDEHDMLDVKECDCCDFAFDSSFASKKSLTLEDNGIWRGGANYKATIKAKSVFIEGAADFITIYDGDKFVGTQFATGGGIFANIASGVITVRAEKWGHSNFDDSRKKSLRIQSSKGIKNIYEVIENTELGLWQFVEEREWLAKTLKTPTEFSARVGVNSWNSTHAPIVCAYHAEISPIKSDKTIIQIEGGSAEVALYVNGRFVSEFDASDKIVDITGFVTDKNASTKLKIALLIRKREWSEPAGKVKLVALNKADVKFCAIIESALSGLRAKNTSPAKFPLKIDGGKIKLLNIDLKNLQADCYGVVTGQDYKLTICWGDRVIARMVAPSWENLSQQGGSDIQFLIPMGFRTDGILTILAESIGNDTVLNFAIEYNRADAAKIK